jgi:hypothetical protein
MSFIGVIDESGREQDSFPCEYLKKQNTLKIKTITTGVDSKLKI